ncbi:hypothetical protein BD410DRAFT_241212 [Rickenella mellea]|uniref:Uncharacterized protein n=1 Tax=Rickenella mellea TaxID=50990 RepID=A0A4Y7QNS4_9AGAM|nr:hypothetical protein BD410DRAFT_241212 [Rickenella mellea]
MVYIICAGSDRAKGGEQKNVRREGARKDFPHVLWARHNSSDGSARFLVPPSQLFCKLAHTYTLLVCFRLYTQDISAYPQIHRFDQEVVAGRLHGGIPGKCICEGRQDVSDFTPSWRLIALLQLSILRFGTWPCSMLLIIVCLTECFNLR